jgi:hypothetical protein
MAADKPSSFHCPNCNALYQVIKVETGPETVGREITCLCCEAPLIGREGNLVVKYFLLQKGRRARSGERASQKHAEPKTAGTEDLSVAVGSSLVGETFSPAKR